MLGRSCASAGASARTNCSTSFSPTSGRPLDSLKGEGVEVENLRTPYGPLTYSLCGRGQGHRLTLKVAAGYSHGPGSSHPAHLPEQPTHELARRRASDSPFPRRSHRRRVVTGFLTAARLNGNGRLEIFGHSPVPRALGYLATFIRTRLERG
jgi:hypothetical protein